MVNALEARGGEGRGVEGDVEFEKVGWGRWDAKRRHPGARDRQGTPSSSFGSGIPISKRGGRAARSSLGEDTFQFSHEEHGSHILMETEADRMSLDGLASASCSEAPDDDFVMNDDPEDLTDDEDWAAMGAAALRADSYPSMGAAQRLSDLASTGGLRTVSVSTGMARPPQPTDIDLLALAGASDAQEREAVEALLRLGSV